MKEIKTTTECLECGRTYDTTVTSHCPECKTPRGEHPPTDKGTKPRSEVRKKTA